MTPDPTPSPTPEPTDSCDRCNCWKPWRHPFFCRRCQKQLAAKVDRENDGEWTEDDYGTGGDWR